MDEIFVSVYEDASNDWYECGSVEVRSDLDDETAVLIAKGLVFESDWIPGSVTLCVSREDVTGLRILYEGL